MSHEKLDFQLLQSQDEKFWQYLTKLPHRNNRLQESSGSPLSMAQRLQSQHLLLSLTPGKMSVVICHICLSFFF